MDYSKTRLQRGHFTMKSSALAPTSTSYMGQDFIANHMKSHYRRILSAKAAIDTSPPKSMNMHMKVRDQKKRAALESRAGTPLSLRSRTPSMEFLSSSHNGSSPMNSARSQMSPGRRPSTGPGRRPSTGTPMQRSLSVQSLDRHYPPAVPTSSPRDIKTSAQNQSTSTSAQLSMRPPVSPIAKEARQTLRTGRQVRKKKDLRTLHSLEKSEVGTSHNLDNVSTLINGYNDESGDVKTPMTAGYSAVEHSLTKTRDESGMLNGMKDPFGSMRDERVPRLDLTEVTYSHRGPPSIRTMNDSTDFKATVWEEEQRYLKFISDVTTDILARGIFSNRVLKQVFEMHIDRRKDHLDESRLQEMIEQLKDDLGITDS